MSLFQKAINNDFQGLSSEEVLEMFPLLFYTVDGLTDFLAGLELTIHEAARLSDTADLLHSYVHDVPFHSILVDAAKQQQANRKGSMFSKLNDPGCQYICNEFDNINDQEKKFRIILNEVSKLLDFVENTKPCSFEYFKSELMNNLTFHTEIKLVLCVLIHQKPLLWSTSRVVKGLLHCERGFDLIRSIVLNFPHQWHAICFSLIESANRIQGTIYQNALPLHILNVIKDIIHLNPPQIYSIFEYCIINQMLPELVLNIAIDLNNKGELCILDFLKRILLDEGKVINQWFAQYLRAIRNGEQLEYDLSNKLFELARSFIKVSNGGTLMANTLVKAQILLKVLAAMKTFAYYQFQPELSKLLIDLITLDAPIMNISVDYIQLSIAFVIGMRSNFYFNDKHPCNMDNIISSWLRDLVSKQDIFQSRLDNSYSELLLLFALFYHNKQLFEITKMISTILGFEVQDLTSSINMLKKVFINDVFTEQVLTIQAVNVPVTKNLSASHTGHLPIDCVLQLFKLKSFSRNRVKIDDWIYRQMCNCVVPIHPKLPQLIDCYVDTLLPSDMKVQRGNDPLPEQTIINMFGSTIVGHPLTVCTPSSKSCQLIINNTDLNKDLTPQLLILYYILTLYDVHNIQLSDETFKKYNKFPYSYSIWQNIPIKYLLVHVEKNVSQYLDLYPMILRLLATHFPQLICGDLTIQDNFIMNDHVMKSYQAQDDINPTHLNKIFQSYIQSNGRECYELVKIVHLLMESNPDCLISYVNLIVEHIHDMLGLLDKRDALVHYRLLNDYKVMWIKLHLIMPRRIENLTINKWQRSLASDGDFLSILKASQPVNYSEEQVLENLVEILLVNIDQRVFRSVPCLNIMLRIIESTLVSSHTYWLNFQKRSEYNSQSITSKKFENVFGYIDNRSSELDLLRKSFLENQEATVIHILLEKCIPGVNETNDCKSTALTEIQKIICNFIHSKFISDQDLCHIVHLQTYPQKLIPIAVQGIPSMHICLYQIEEMFINCGDYYKMVFLVDLVSYLAMFYTTEKAQEVATKLIEYFTSIIHSIASLEERAMLIWYSTEPILRLGKTFPSLLTTVTAYLLTVSSVCFSVIGINDDCCPAFISNNEDENNLSDSDFENLEIADQYGVCYRKLTETYDILVTEGLVQSQLYNCKMV